MEITFLKNYVKRHRVKRAIELSQELQRLYSTHQTYTIGQINTLASMKKVPHGIIQYLQVVFLSKADFIQVDDERNYECERRELLKTLYKSDIIGDLDEGFCPAFQKLVIKNNYSMNNAPTEKHFEGG